MFRKKLAVRSSAGAGSATPNRESVPACCPVPRTVEDQLDEANCRCVPRALPYRSLPEAGLPCSIVQAKLVSPESTQAASNLLRDCVAENPRLRPRFLSRLWVSRQTPRDNQ